MKDTPWFRHDQNAGDDEKILALQQTLTRLSGGAYEPEPERTFGIRW